MAKKKDPLSMQLSSEQMSPVLQAALGLYPGTGRMPASSPMTPWNPQSAINDLALNTEEARTQIATPQLAVDRTTAIPPVQAPQVMNPGPKPRGGGQSAQAVGKNTMEQMLSQGNVLQTDVLRTPEEERAAYEMAASNPAIQRQLADNQTQREILGLEMQAPSDAVTGPLASLLQTEFGKNVSGFLATRGPSPEERRAKLQGSLDKITDNQKDAAKTIADYMAKLRTGVLTEKTNATSKAMASQSLMEGAKDPEANTKPNNFDVNNYDKFNRLTKGTLQKDDEFATKLGDLIGQVASGNPVDDAQISVIRATMAAGGRPNIAEVKMEAGSKAFIDRAQNAFDFLTSGNMSEANRQRILESLQVLSEYRQKKRDAKFQQLKEMGTGYNQPGNKINATLPESYQNVYPSAHPKTGSQPQLYTGKEPLPTNASDQQKKMRQMYLQNKAKGAQ